MLGRRLEMESDGQRTSDAHLCYIVSGNTEQLVASWDKVLADSSNNHTLQVIDSLLAGTKCWPSPTPVPVFNTIAVPKRVVRFVTC